MNAAGAYRDWLGRLTRVEPKSLPGPDPETLRIARLFQQYREARDRASRVRADDPMYGPVREAAIDLELRLAEAIGARPDRFFLDPHTGNRAVVSPDGELFLRCVPGRQKDRVSSHIKRVI